MKLRNWTEGAVKSDLNIVVCLLSPPLLSSDVMMCRESVKHVALWRYVLIGAIRLTLLFPAYLRTNTPPTYPTPTLSLSFPLFSLSFSVSLISSVLNSSQECPDKLVKNDIKLLETQTNRFNIPCSYSAPWWGDGWKRQENEGGGRGNIWQRETENIGEIIFV